MDKNFIIGLVLILLMLIGYQILVPKPVEPTPVAQIKNDIKNSSVASTVTPDSSKSSSQTTDSASVTKIEAKDIVFETADARIVFSNKGGVLKEVMLKKYKTFDQKPLYLIAENHNKFQIDFPTQTGDVRLTDMYFTTEAQGQTLAEKDSAIITYRTDLKNNQYVEQTYVVHGKGYLIDYGIKSNGVGLGDKSIQFDWKNDLLQLENDMHKNREVVTINYFTDGLQSLATSPTAN